MRGLPQHWVTIDPGDVHVGMAYWQGGRCYEVIHCDPRECESRLESGLIDAPNLDLVVYERFALDPRRARLQDGSEFGTCQLIGVIKYLCRKGEVPSIGYRNNEHKRITNMDWFMERTSTRAKEQLMPYWTPGPRGGTKITHKLDAWTLGMWHKHKLGYVEGEGS